MKNKNKSVLITGTSTGMGNATVKHLSSKGYHVYAGVRKQSDFKNWEKIGNVTPVMLDVTESEMIKEVFDLIKDDNNFYGLVNNAGKIESNPLLNCSYKELLEVFDVNLFGPIQLIQTFYALLEQNKGRIINISSINGFVPAAKDGGYSMAKHALEAFSEQLFAEINPHVKVSVIQPGLFKTAMTEKVLAQLQHMAAEGDEDAKQGVEFYTNDENYNDPIEIAKQIQIILEEDQPKFRYILGNEMTEQWAVNSLLSRLITSSFSSSFDRKHFEGVMTEIYDSQ